jgi:hypothetical protein
MKICVLLLDTLRVIKESYEYYFKGVVILCGIATRTCLSPTTQKIRASSYRVAGVQPKLSRTIVLEIWMNVPRVVKVAAYKPLLLLRSTDERNRR